MSDADDIPPTELRDRVIYALLLAPARLARVTGMDLGDLVQLLEMAVFHELREHGAKMREVAAQLGISMRKTAQLSARLKRNFMDTEREHTLPRRVEFVLWAGPQSRPRLHQFLDAEPDAIDEALERLVADGRVRIVEEDHREVFEVTRSEARLVHDRLLARIDGLTNLVGTVAHAAHGRFFDDEPWSFARTVSLRVRDADRDRLRALYTETIWPALKALDDAAQQDDEDTTQVDISLCWAPYEALNERGPDDDE